MFTDIQKSPPTLALNETRAHGDVGLVDEAILKWFLTGQFPISPETVKNNGFECC